MNAVARKFSATWEAGDDSADAYLTFAGNRIAVDITTLGNEPRLRFDKVATRLMERLKAATGDTVPHGMTVLLAITAPIRLPSKTADWLEDKIQVLLRTPTGRDEKDTVHGNQVIIRLLRHGSERAPKMIGFVHNPDSDPLPLLNMTSELLKSIKVGRAGDRWLVAIGAESSSR